MFSTVIWPFGRVRGLPHEVSTGTLVGGGGGGGS